MNSSVESTQRPVPGRRSRWQTLCFILAACNLLAVGIGLDLSHRLMAIYTESVRLNREWSNRLGSYSELGQLAAAVHAPANDVIDTQDVAAESAELDKAVARFSEKMSELREEANSPVPVTEAKALLQEMDAVQDAIDQMSGEARLIFSCFRDNQPDEAGNHMPTMDRKFAHLNAVLLRLQSRVREIQEARLGDKLARASSVRKIETALGLALMLMLIGIALYRGRLFRTAAPFPQSEETQQAVETTLRDITERRKAETEREEQARLFAFRADVDHALSHNQSIPTMLQGCAVAMQKHVDAALARIWMFDLTRAQLELQASAGVDTRLDGPHSRIPVGQFEIGLIAKEKVPRLTNELPSDPAARDQEWARYEGIVSFAGYPLLVGEVCVGVLAVFARQPLARRILEDRKSTRLNSSHV